VSRAPDLRPRDRAILFPRMYIGLGVFAVLAVVCVFAGAAVMKRRREYGDSDADGEMGEAEFRRYEGFDE
jgi:hypothetical protein